MILLLLSTLLAACHVRTPEFHCRVEARPTDNMELAMSPLELRYGEHRFNFVEARGNQRLYRDESQSRLVVFDLATMALTEYAKAQDGSSPAPAQSVHQATTALHFDISMPIVKQWRCERYKML